MESVGSPFSAGPAVGSSARPEAGPNDANERFSRLVLVFPKQFEMGKFMVSMHELYECYFFQTSDSTCFFGVLETESSFFHFVLLCFNVMDAEFNTRFIEFVYANHDKGLSFLMMGTCGGVGMEIGDARLVTKACKYDRGALKAGGVLQLRHDRALFLEAPGPASDVVICSANFVCEDPSLLPQAAKLVDMETFDFFSICKGMKQNFLGAIRVVSDVPGQKYDEKTRAMVSFDRAAQRFVATLRASGAIHPVRFNEFEDIGGCRVQISKALGAYDFATCKIEWQIDAQVRPLHTARDWIFEKLQAKKVSTQEYEALVSQLEKNLNRRRLCKR